MEKPVYRPKVWQVIGAVIVWALLLGAVGWAVGWFVNA